ncbi:MAG TPA: energy transducer TonB [Pyrinomonadaceae bacterium]|nr:energy transducer TonB [Pyrinomonadaceae bacterium]
MKQCPTCQEEFAEKFGFCPVDGTPLNGHIAQAVVTAPVVEEPSTINASPVVEAEPPSEPSNGYHQNGNGEETVASQAVSARDDFHLTFLEDEGLTRRLSKELKEVAHQSQLTWPEFKRDPVGFTKRSATAYAGLTRRFFNQPYVGLAVTIGVAVMALVVAFSVLPYARVYKWLFSDGKLVAEIGMPLDEVRKRSTINLDKATKSQLDGSNAVTLSADKLNFDFEALGTGLKFDWSRSFVLQTDENQQVTGISIEASSRNETWRQLRASLDNISERLDEIKGWRALANEDDISSASLMKAKLQEPAIAEGSLGDFKWINDDTQTILTISARRLQPAANGEDPSVGPQFVHTVTLEKGEANHLLAMLDIPKEPEPPKEGPAGTAKGKGGGAKPKYEKPAGGGGGGDKNPLPVSYGKPAPAVETDLRIPPSVRPPTVSNPKLTLPQAVKGDSVLMPPDPRNLPMGDLASTQMTPSNGPGSGGGQGTGTGSGQGSGNGKGRGPGDGENTGGGSTNYGGGGPGGGGGGAPEPKEDYRRTFKMSEVSRKALIISKPDPGFTEEARKNNVTGVVRLKAVLSSSGAVTGIAVLKGLPDGLTERAIAAARNIKFQPAQKDGRTVSQYITLEYSFNIY